MATISGSVGKGGRNNRQDVITVQQLLKKANVNPGPVDGICGPKTINAIIQFQARFMSRPDGLVEVGQTTWRKLNAAAGGPGSAPGQPTPPAPPGQPTPPATPQDWQGESHKWSQEKKLASLNASFRPKVETLLQRMRARGFQPKIFYGWRSVAVQQELVRQGKSKVSFSFHNAQKPDGTPNAYAADIIDERYGWAESAKTSGYWAAQGEEAKKLGLVWGGDWSFYDPAHVQFLANSELGRVKRESGL